ncbi:Hypothetical predicted protein [Paramuricea clavata]|nr:Hypothetical predicted protein [Paramuricea clavata]
MTADGQTTSTVQTNTVQSSTIDHEQVTAGQVVSQLTNEADVQLAEVLVAVSDALVAANQEQTSNEDVQLIQEGTEGQANADGSVQILETGEQQGIETDMNADQTVPIITSEESGQIIHNAQVIDATQLTEEQLMQVSNITNVQTSEGQLIAMNVEDAHVIDPSQLHALSVIAEAAKGNQIHIPDIIAAAAASGVNITTSDDVDHIVAVQAENGQQAHVEIQQEMQEGVVTTNQEEQPMETA